jgi:hypothetical protein
MALSLEHDDFQCLCKRCRDGDSRDSPADHDYVDHFRVHRDTVFTFIVMPGFLHTGHIFPIREFWPVTSGGLMKP